MKMFAPKFCVAPRVYRLLEQITEVRERVRGSLVKVPWVPVLAKDAMARLAWGSTAIEGCTLSLEAVRGLLEGRTPAAYPDREVRTAANYLRALRWLQSRQPGFAMGEVGLFKLHRLIGEGVLEEGPLGGYRRVDVRAGLHRAPPWRQVPALTQGMLLWLKRKAAELPAVFSSAILHLRFVEIHPFRDGNGRIARALGTWELYRRGFDTLHVFALDEVLLENRTLYIRALQRVQVARQDLGGWLEFMAEALLETLERVDKRIQGTGLSGRRQVSLTWRQERLLRILRERGPLGARELARGLRLTVPGVHYALKLLLKEGILRRLGAHKTSRYSLP